MVDKIIEYLRFLTEHYGLYISLHAKDSPLCKFFDALAPFTMHSNPYCIYIKSNRIMWDKCLMRQQGIYSRTEDKPFCDCCFAGVCEYIFPIIYNGVHYGFVFVSGYTEGGDAADKISRYLSEFGYLPSITKREYQNNLKAKDENFKNTEALIYPLISMLILLCLESPDTIGSSGTDFIYGHALIYIHSHYSEKIRIRDIADFCYVSESYLSRIFKRKSKSTIANYIKKYRIEKAKDLLRNTDMSVCDIGLCTGFSDSNYFISVFTTLNKMSPLKFKKSFAHVNPLTF